MDKVDVIKITKEFEKENVVNAVMAYMTPKSEDFRLAKDCMGETYIVRLLGRKKKSAKAKKQQLPDEWVENCSVKLSFDSDTCTVGIFCQTYGAADVVAIGAMAGFGIFVGFGIPMLIGSGLMAAKGGSEAAGAKRFRKDILKIVESFICDETLKEKQPKAQKALEEKRNTSKGVYVCECGNKLDKNQNFCPECGKPRDNGMRTCKCGQEVEKHMKFCPYCGEQMFE